MLNYRLHGELGNTAPLLVLHGLLGSLDNWNTFARQQTAQRAVLALDLRNHGDSPHVDGMSYREMADDVLGVMDELHISACDLMGHSMGGKVAMALALQNPDRVQRLLVVDIAPHAYPPRHNELLQAMNAMPLAEIRSRKQADEWLAPVVKHPLERGFLLKNLGRNQDGKFYWQCNLPEITRQYLKISGFPAFDARYEKPACFIRGGQSDYVQDQDLPLIREYFPAAELRTIDAAGHLPHVQTPADFTRLTEAFLA